MPTPPAAACTRTLSPGRRSPRSVKRVERGQEHHRHRRALRERQPGGQPADHPLVDLGHRPERTTEQAHHPVSGREPRDAGADRRDDPGALQPRRGRRAGVHAQGVQDVPEVHAGGTHGNPHRARRDRSGELGAGHDGQPVEGAALGDVDAPRPGRDGQRVGFLRQPRHPGHARADRDLVLPRRQGVGDGPPSRRSRPARTGRGVPTAPSAPGPRPRRARDRPGRRRLR